MSIAQAVASAATATGAFARPASGRRSATARAASLSSRMAVPVALRGAVTSVQSRSRQQFGIFAEDKKENKASTAKAAKGDTAELADESLSSIRFTENLEDAMATLEQEAQGMMSMMSDDEEDPTTASMDQGTIIHQPTTTTPFVLPVENMEGLWDDVEEVGIDDSCESDGVYNHELSWLGFNWRVLAMAMDQQTPLLERLRFIAIVHRNLDEFFAKRVGALKRQEAAGLANLKNRSSSVKGIYTPTMLLDYIAKAVNKQVDAVEECLLDDVVPSLADRGLALVNYDECTLEEKQNFDRWFLKELEPLLTPLAVDPGHPFPYLASLAINLAVVLHDPEMPGETRQFAIVTVPSSIGRWRAIDGRPNTYVPVEQVVSANLDHLFGGMVILSVSPFRATRNADVARNEEEAEDLLEMMTDEVRERKFAPFVRLEVADGTPEEVRNILASQMLMRSGDVYECKGPLDMGEFFSLRPNDPTELVNATEVPMEYEQWNPLTHTQLYKEKDRAPNIFRRIREGDIIVQHPYNSFATSTQMFVETAARDPKVVAIKATLYRTNSDSPIINALLAAAENGKQVAVLVELKARFDEARNVGFAQKLETGGCNVAYGLVGLKTHSKTTMVLRNEDGVLRTYVHIGTGNYNPATAGVYTDFGLFSADPELGADVSDLFKYLTGYHRQASYRKLLVAPVKMRRQFEQFIDREIAAAKDGKEAYIVAKVNGLDDKVITKKLYEASQAGVRVDLIVRGICRVRAGVPGLSENIRLVSIIGRFLEHHRVYTFCNGGEPTCYIGSADWMTRNLMRRVEVVTPIEDPSLKQDLFDMLDGCLQDHVGAWEMLPDGRYQRPVAPREPRGKSFVTVVGPDGRRLPGDKGYVDVTSWAVRANEVGVQVAVQERESTIVRKHKQSSRRATQPILRTARKEPSGNSGYFSV